MLVGELHFLSISGLLHSGDMRKLNLLRPVSAESLLATRRPDEWPFLLVGVDNASTFWMNATLQEGRREWEPPERKRHLLLDGCWVPYREGRPRQHVQNTDVMHCSLEVALANKTTRPPAALLAISDLGNERIRSFRLHAERLVSDYRCRVDALSWAQGKQMYALVGRRKHSGPLQAWVAAFLPVDLEDDALTGYGEGQKIVVELTSPPSWADDPPNATLRLPAKIVDNPSLGWDRSSLGDFLYRTAPDHPCKQNIPDALDRFASQRLWLLRTDHSFPQGNGLGAIPGEESIPSLPGELCVESVQDPSASPGPPPALVWTDPVVPPPPPPLRAYWNVEMVTHAVLVRNTPSPSDCIEMLCSLLELLTASLGSSEEEFSTEQLQCGAVYTAQQALLVLDACALGGSAPSEVRRLDRTRRWTSSVIELCDRPGLPAGIVPESLGWVKAIADCFQEHPEPERARALCALAELLAWCAQGTLGRNSLVSGSHGTLGDEGPVAVDGDTRAVIPAPLPVGSDFQNAAVYLASRLCHAIENWGKQLPANALNIGSFGDQRWLVDRRAGVCLDVAMECRATHFDCCPAYLRHRRTLMWRKHVGTFWEGRIRQITILMGATECNHLLTRARLERDLGSYLSDVGLPIEALDHLYRAEDLLGDEAEESGREELWAHEDWDQLRWELGRALQDVDGGRIHAIQFLEWAAVDWRDRYNRGKNVGGFVHRAGELRRLLKEQRSDIGQRFWQTRNQDD